MLKCLVHKPQTWIPPLGHLPASCSLSSCQLPRSRLLPLGPHAVPCILVLFCPRIPMHAVSLAWNDFFHPIFAQPTLKPQTCSLNHWSPSGDYTPCVWVPLLITLPPLSFFMKSPAPAPDPQWPCSLWVLGKHRQNKKLNFIHNTAASPLETDTMFKPHSEREKWQRFWKPLYYNIFSRCLTDLTTATQQCFSVPGP